ncbi:MAG TPA: hypothetical protein VFY10_12535, partial [Dehalococcoidia bacterium]|nr:hypothetical protein [Dehalococcoidia bacterium]
KAAYGSLQMPTTRNRDDEWLLKVRAIAPITEQHRDQGESERHLPQAIYEAMGDTGLYKLLLAKVYGGIEADVQSSVFAMKRWYVRTARSVGTS